MAFLERLTAKEQVLAKRRGRAVDQLGKDKTVSPKNSESLEEPLPPAKLLEQQPENLKEPLSEDKIKVREEDRVNFGFDEDEDGEEKQPESLKVPIGKKICRPGRYSKIRGWKPWLTIVAGATEIEKLGRFFKDLAGVMNNDIYIERLLGKAPSAQNQGLDTIYAYLSTEAVAKAIAAKAKILDLPVYMQDMEVALGKARPFDGLSYGAKISQSIGGNLQNLANALQKALDKVKDCEGDTTGGEMPALQVNAKIPLNYLRFLSPQQKEREFFIGGHPEGQGREGMIYALAAEDESEHFRKEMKDFGHPQLFYQDLLSLGDIDPGFKSQNVRPRKVVPANAVILTFSHPLKLEQKISEGSEVTLLEALNYYATNVMSKTSGRGGDFLKGSLVQGTINLHFSKDMSRVIVWGTTSPMKVDEEEMKRLFGRFGLAEIDKRYSK